MIDSTTPRHQLFALQATLAGVAVALTAYSGCNGPAEATYPVTGRVTLGDKPVAGAIVTFVPEEGRPGRVVTDSSGSYSKMLAATDYSVSVEPPTAGTTPGASSDIPPDRAPPSASTSRAKSPAIPENYWQHETSGLTLQVNPSDSTSYDIGL